MKEESGALIATSIESPADGVSTGPLEAGIHRYRIECLGADETHPSDTVQVTVADRRFHIIFVTSQTYKGGAFGGLTGADVRCRDLAGAIGLMPGRSWRALLSDSYTDARSRVVIEGPLENVLGHQVASGAAELFGSNLRTAVAYDELGNRITDRDNTWTGSYADGTRKPNKTCNNWINSKEKLGNFGHASSTTDWLRGQTGEGDNECHRSNHLYCLSQ